MILEIDLCSSVTKECISNIEVSSSVLYGSVVLSACVADVGQCHVNDEL